MSVAHHHPPRVERTLMRTLHLTNILLPLSLITVPCVSPSQCSIHSRKTRNETQAPHTSLCPRACCGPAAALPCLEGVAVGLSALSLCREVGVCSLHGELCYYLMWAETSCRPLVDWWFTMLLKVLLWCVASVDNVFKRQIMTYWCNHCRGACCPEIEVNKS